MYRARLMFRDGQMVRLAIANDHGDTLMVWEKANTGLTEIEALVSREDVLRLIREFWGSSDAEADLIMAEETARDVRVERLAIVRTALS
jgi:hypothetical protein